MPTLHHLAALMMMMMLVLYHVATLVGLGPSAWSPVVQVAHTQHVWEVTSRCMLVCPTAQVDSHGEGRSVGYCK